MNITEHNYKWNGSLSERKQTNKLILHHAEASRCCVEDIHRWHLQRGWTGIGYHYFVNKSGEIHRGRPENVQGAHCKGYNYESIGICVEGKYNTEEMPKEQFESVVWLVNDILNRYPDITIFKHCELNATDCPGINYPYNKILNRLSKKVIKENSEIKVRYTKAVQSCFNESTETKLPLDVDGIWGDQTEKAWNMLKNLGKEGHI